MQTSMSLLELKKMARSTCFLHYHLKNSKKKRQIQSKEKRYDYAIFHISVRGVTAIGAATLELRNRNRLINHKSVKKLMDELELKR